MIAALHTLSITTAFNIKKEAKLEETAGLKSTVTAMMKGTGISVREQHQKCL